MTTVSVLGLGLMGSSVAEAFLDAGHDVTVWNRNAAKCALFIAAGARAADTPAAAIAASDVSVLVLTDYDAVATILAEVTVPSADRISRTVINLTSGVPEAAADMERTVTRHGLGYLDGAVLAYPKDIGGTADVVISGPRDTWQKCHDCLDALGTGTVFAGESIEFANVIDCAVTGGFFVVALAAFFEATAYAATYGVQASALVPYATRWAELLGPEMELGAQQIAADDYTTDQATIDTYELAVSAITESVRQTGPAHLNTGVLANLREAQAAGRSHEAIAAIHAALRGSAPV